MNTYRCHSISLSILSYIYTDNLPSSSLVYTVHAYTCYFHKDQLYSLA